MERPRFAEPPAVLLELGRSLRELHSAMLQMSAEDATAEASLRDAHDHVRRAIEAISSSGLLPRPDATREPERRPRYGFGPVVGAFFFVILREYLAQAITDAHLIVFGVLFILVVLLLPGGLVEAWHRLLRLARPGAKRISAGPAVGA